MTKPTSITPIGHIKSPFKQKFAIPRQPRLATAAISTIELFDDFNHPDMVRDLEQYSHLWLIFSFHQNVEQGWTPLVRPPRLGGNKKTGVLATRATFRPNSLGMSAVKLERVIILEGRAKIEVSGADLLDGTPIFDIKPYLPYSDIIADADGGFAQDAPLEPMQVQFSKEALAFLNNTPTPTNFKQLIEQILAQDPRPAYKKNKQDNKEYAVELYQFDVRWHVLDNHALVTKITFASNVGQH